MNGKHWVMYNGTPTSILSPLTFDQMAETYGKDYLGEECNVTGKLTANLASFVMLEQPSNPTTGEAMYDPIHEEVFGESNLADDVIPHIPRKESPVWTDLLGAIEILTEHFQREVDSNPTTTKPATQCNKPNCAFCVKTTEVEENVNLSVAARLLRSRRASEAAKPTEEPTLTPRKRSDIERLLYNAEIQYPESAEFIVVRGGRDGFSLYDFLQEKGYEGSVEEFLDGLLIKPTRPTVEEYLEAAAGNRPFPVNAIAPDSLANALATLPKIKGVNLHDSDTYRGVMNEGKDLLNDPTAHGTAIVNTILALLGIEDTAMDLPEFKEPKAKRFVITRDPVDVYNVFKLFMASTEARASLAAAASRSPDINLAIYEESVESLKRRTYIAFGDIMNVPRLPLDYIVDNAESNVFNLSAKGVDFTQNICTIRYNDKFEYTIEVFR